MTKRNFYITLLFVAMTLSPSAAEHAFAQATSTTSASKGTGRTWKQKFKSILNDGKKSVKDTGKELKDRLGIEDDNNVYKDKDIKVGKEYYMPLYKVNLYKDSDAEVLRADCEKVFRTRYPEATIVSSALPQTEWLIENVKQNGNIIGYREIMYCFVLGKDGDDAYINLKFTFQRYKEVGKNYQNISSKWPELTRVDVIPMNAYKELENN
jgi:hypothetical protein